MCVSAGRENNHRDSKRPNVKRFKQLFNRKSTTYSNSFMAHNYLEGGYDWSVQFFYCDNETMEKKMEFIFMVESLAYNFGRLACAFEHTFRQCIWN